MENLKTTLDLIDTLFSLLTHPEIKREEVMKINQRIQQLFQLKKRYEAK
jgi:hypothetical protein